MNNISINTQAVGVECVYGRSIMASFHGLWSLAGFCGGIISAVLVAWNVDILSNFVGVCIFSIILAVVARQFILPEDIKPDPDPADAGKKRTMFSPTPFIITLGIIAFGCMSCEGTMYDWSVVYFKEIIGADNDTSRFGYIAYMSAMACGRFLGDAFITRYGVMKVLQCSGVLVFIGMIAAVVYPDVLISSLGFLLVGAGVSTVVPICYSMAGKSRRMSSGMAIATVSTIGFFGFLMGPPLIGFIAHALPNFFERTVQLVRVDGVLADTGETVRVYLYSSGDLYSLPPEELETVQTVDDLRGDYFQPTGDADLFRFLTIRRK